MGGGLGSLLVVLPWLDDVCTIPYDFQGRLQQIRMLGCGGRDQVVRQALAAGWRSYEAPLPLVLSTWIAAQPGAFFDIGANTGFYALLAACAGARQVRAFEPVPAIADLLNANLGLNGALATSTVALHRLALSDCCGEAQLFLPDQGHGLIETSASLNPEFRAVHSGALTVPLSRLDDHLAEQPLAEGLPLVIKIDVESCEPQVLRGASGCIARHRPAIFVEILPGSDLAFFEQWIATHDYSHYWLLPPNQVVPAEAITPSLQHRDHLLVPRECSLPLSSSL